MMILNNILVLGNNHSRMDLVEPSIIMVMFIKENLIKVKDVEMEFMSLIKYINILGNGNITVFGDRANFIKIMKHFFKDYFKKD
jgi:NADH:ubiquinone oxidoreductase subunit F (NADH-binding)